MDRRKHKRIMALLLLLAMMMNMVLPVSAAEGDGTGEGAGSPPPETAFTCWTMNGEEKLDGVLADGKYVLSVPQDMEAASVDVFFTGTVTETSAGELAAEDGKVTGAFASGTEVTLTGGENSYTIVLQQEEPETDTVAGTCGENLTWVLDDEGTLTISGTGPMWDFSYEIDWTNGGVDTTIPWRNEDSINNIKKIVVSEGVTTLGDHAFRDLMGVSEAALPNSLAEIGDRAFDDCRKLQQIKLPANVAEIGECAFAGCRALSSVLIPDKITSLKYGTFSYCTSLQEISLPDGLTGIGDYVFEKCAFETVEIPDSVTHIGQWAFVGNEDLTEITIPASVKRVGMQLFQNCTNLKKITFWGDAPVFEDMDGEAIPEQFDNVTATVYYPADNDTWTAEVMQNYGGTITWEAEDTPPFSCFTYDEKGNQIHGYYAEEDDIWYLFVPSTVSISEISLSYTGSVADVSAGTLNKQESAVTGAFSESGDLVTLKNSAGEEYKVQVLQSGLPSVHVVLKDATLDDVHQDKDVKYKNNSVYIMDPQGTYDLAVEGSVEMKGRGNTSWKLYDKKGYQLKFDSKTSVLGMGKAKKWVLLANASDDSMMRTSLTYRMAENMDMAFVPAMEYVDLWVNGEYRGTYMIGDKVELGSSRLDLQNDQGVIFEHDEAFYKEEDHWIFSEQLQRHFALKEIVEEEDSVIEAAKTDFQEAVDELVEYIRSELPSEVTLEELNQMIDVDSFIQYYLVTEYVLNREAIVTSFYWYKDGPEDVIHLGPIWDYDTCMGNDRSEYTGTSAEYHPLFTYLLAIPAFYERAETLKSQYWSYLSAMDEDVDVVKAMIEESAQMNYLRWDSLGKPSVKGGTDFADTYEEAVQNVKTWLEGREQAFTISSKKMISSTVSERCDKMEICYDDDDAGYQNVKFAVWHDTKHQSDLRWYPATRDADGILRATADLVRHNRKGLYHIDAYVFQSNGSKKKIATGQSYVKDIYVPDYTIRADVAEDCATMKITFTDINPHKNIRFAVWSDADGQNDLTWYQAKEKENGTWSYTVDLRNHNSAGMYNIHVYSVAGGVYTKHAEHRIRVAKAVAPPVRAEVSENCDTMQLAFAPDVQQENIHFAVWSDVNGQDDLAWYAAQKAGTGEWTYNTDLQKHNSAGLYNIHVYSITDGVYTKHAEFRVHVEKAAISPVTVTVSENCDIMQIVFDAQKQHEHVHFAVWSDVDGQDDLHWYASRKNADGKWEYTVDLQDHNSAGTYHIHVYSIDGGVYNKEMERRAEVEKIAVFPVTVAVSQTYEAMELTFADDEQHKNIHFAVWSETGGQDDLHWYTAQKDAEGKWAATVDLRTHNTAGIYHIHVYSVVDAALVKQAEHRAKVDKAANCPVTLKVAENKQTMEVVFKDSTQHEHIHFAVWSDVGGQDDLHWYVAEKTAAGQWSYQVNLQDHASEGTFYVHVYSISGTTYTKQFEDSAIV